jgi:hypothetical protein
MNCSEFSTTSPDDDAICCRIHRYKQAALLIYLLHLHNLCGRRKERRARTRMRGVEGGGGGCSISRGEGLGAQIHDEGVEARMQNRGGSLRTAL